MPPKATFLPRLWQRASSTATQTRPAGDELQDEHEQEGLAQLVPVPVGATEEVVDGAVMAGAIEDTGLPDLGEAARPQADEPGLDDGAEGGVGLGAEARAEVA